MNKSIAKKMKQRSAGKPDIELGKRIRLRRVEQKISQAELGEKLGVEMGMYDTPYDRFGMLTFQMWRAARLVVDTGVHHKGWSRAQAIQFLHDNTALADHDIEIEVDRYISWPGQALSYYLGMMAISDLRAKAEAALGPKFDIRAFHDTVLSTGAVPLPVLRARIDRFIAEGGRDPMPVTWQKAARP